LYKFEKPKTKKIILKSAERSDRSNSNGQNMPLSPTNHENKKIVSPDLININRSSQNKYKNGANSSLINSSMRSQSNSNMSISNMDHNSINLNSNINTYCERGIININNNLSLNNSQSRQSEIINSNSNERNEKISHRKGCNYKKAELD